MGLDIESWMGRIILPRMLYPGPEAYLWSNAKYREACPIQNQSMLPNEQ